MYKGFIFDMDGVIIDSEPFHLDIEEKYFKSLGIKEPRKFLNRYAAVNLSEMLTEAIKYFDLDISLKDMLFLLGKKKKDEFKKSELTSIKGINDLLFFLKTNGFKIALASSTQLDIIEIVLQKLDISRFFDAVVSGEEVKNGKPAPDIFIEASKRLGLDPEDCIVLEDSKFGTIAAKRAGMVCIGFLNPNSGRQDLKSADHIISSIDLILPIISL